MVKEENQARKCAQSKRYSFGPRGDELVSPISETLGALLVEYGSKLDVIYDDGLKFDDYYKVLSEMCLR